MSSIEINQVLIQLRAMSAAAGGTEGPAQSHNTTGADFSSLMQEALHQVSDVQGEAAELAKAFESGDTKVELPEVMVALQKANISFQAVTQVRNKLLNAYQEVMNMQV